MIHFTDDCLTGIGFIDEEHKYLFELMGKLLEISQNEFITDRYDYINSMIRELENYSERHFQDEEDYMLKIRDPELVRQRMQHNYFRLKVAELAYMDKSEETDQQNVLNETVRFLAKWLYSHIIGSDILIGKLLPVEEWRLKENPCEFTEEYVTGIALVDAEHRELFRIIESAYKLVKEEITDADFPEIQEILLRLKNYCKEHFGDEEEYMESIEYTGIDAQKRAHKAFIARMESVDMNKVEGNPQHYLEELVEYLLGWLVNHILYLDKKIPVVGP